MAKEKWANYSAIAALESMLQNWMFVAVGGFGLSGIQQLSLRAIEVTGIKDLTFAPNGTVNDDFDGGVVLEFGRAKN